ncbi:MAG: 16S rRNA (uracil(1498)-N(3))-methyltransferase [Candidatus Rickettsia vulgarisii]
MKFSNLPRIYANIKLIESHSLDLPEDKVHYLKTVLRLKSGNYFRVFNGVDGEFIAQITNITKNNLFANVTSISRKISPEPQINLAISIIKNDKMLDAINMAVQLGVTKIIPLIADRSQHRNINISKLSKCIVEYTEQSERLVLPILEQAITLGNFLKQNSNNPILYANENEDESNDLLKLRQYIKPNISVLIGPEGGFSQNELQLLASVNNCYSFSLGATVLRAETAVAACLAQVKLFLT